MKTKLSTFLSLLILTVTTSYAQSKSCDTIYKYTEVIAQFKNEQISLDKYFDKHIIPILVRSRERDNNIITKLQIVLTINSRGNVVDATFSRAKLSERCKEELKKELLTMEGWQSAIMNNQSVCSTYLWPIHCLKWQ